MKTEKTLAMTLIGLMVVGVFAIVAVFQNGGKPLVEKLPTVKGVVIVVEK